MDDFSHIFYAALSIFVGDTLFMLPPSIPCSLPPPTSFSNAQWQLTSSGKTLRGRRDEGQRPGTRSSLPWSSRAIEEELPTHVLDLQDCSLKKWQGKYDERIAENMICIVLKRTMDSNRIFYLSRSFYNLQERTCQKYRIEVLLPMATYLTIPGGVICNNYYYFL
jgi:hypothetical protein